jgi:hypothetical protein
VATRDTLSSGAANFMAFSPDAEYLLTSDGTNTTLRKPETLEAIGADPLWVNGTMPDWSADKSLVVYVAHKGLSLPFPFPMPFGSPGVSGETSLKLAGWDDAAKDWKGGALDLVPPNGSTQYYPTFSPDSRFVVFNRSGGNSYDAPDAELWIVRAQPGATAHKLEAANQGPDLGNSWPKFGPFTHRYRGRSLMWLTFSSKRAYGLKLNASPGATDKRAQIWMAAIDPERTEMSVDPSYPAFWLPFQDINTGNHIAQWTAEVVRKPCGIDRTCPSGEECKDDGYCDAK